ncbi:putative oxidoreductase ucpA [Pyrenochaeta sp. MPI-SDFR-AT-0127]|nr:putative oxidoreductase ucpA [Pyrenochaeta sp. MPI-SDFR-AT-0127]
MSFPQESGIYFPGESNLHNDIYPAINPQLTPSLHQPGKVVLITGAGRGIGRSIALQYAHAGVASIIICARTGSELDEVEGAVKAINQEIRVLKFTVDVTNEDDIKSLAKEVERVEKRLDVLVNNAGGTNPWMLVGDSDPTSWWHTLEVNLKGPFLFFHAFLPLLVSTAEQGKRTVDVVNVSSIGANFVMPTASAYSISKFALNRLTEYQHAEYADKGVNAVVLHPGGIHTKLADSEPSAHPFLNDTVELPGGFVVWLTAGARTWLGGRFVSVSWDVDALEKLKDETVAEDKLKTRLVV